MGKSTPDSRTNKNINNACVCLFWGVGVALGRAGDGEAQERAQDDLELESRKSHPIGELRTELAS